MTPSRPGAGDARAGPRGGRQLVAGGLLGAAGWALFSLSLASERVQWAPLDGSTGPVAALAALAAALARALVASGIEAGSSFAAAFGLALAAASAGWVLLVCAARARALPPAGALALALVFSA